MLINEAAGAPLPDESISWALVNRIVTDLRRQPQNQSERVSQALLGEAVRILEEREGWARVQTERDGGLGWLHTPALWRCRQTDVEAYQHACTALVPAELLPTYLRLTPIVPERGGMAGIDEAGKLPFGVALAVVEQREMWAAIRLPDGAQWWASNIFLPLANRPRPDASGIAFTLGLIRRFIGVPYLLGGRTPFGFDGAGLAQTFWGFMGVAIPREASQQFQAGLPIEEAPQPGNLVFFGEADPEGSHPASQVAISLGGDDLLHANPATWSVACHSLNAGSPNYFPWLCDHLLGVRRFT